MYKRQNGCNIYTLHCESGSGAVGDIRDLVRHAVSPFIIGGDMNSTPSELSDNLRIMTTGTRSRPGNSAYFACCGMPTHISGRELDYFLIDSRLQLKTCLLYTSPLVKVHVMKAVPAATLCGATMAV